MLSLFNYTLQINRRVQAERELVQSSRAFVETLTREVRNGRIDYSSWTPECDASNYGLGTNQSLSLLTKSGDLLCFYVDTFGQLTLIKKNSQGTSTDIIFDTTRLKIISNTFRFHVYPQTDPNPVSGPYPRIQPFVTLTAQFQLNKVDMTPDVLNYQTTISSDVYDIFH